MTEPADTLDRYRPRSDVRAVPPQAEDAAKRCPLRVQFDVHPPSDVTRAEPSEVDQLRRSDAVAFTERMLDQLASAVPGAVRIPQDRPLVDQQAATVAAMASGASAVLAGALPVDEAGRRRCRPDVLVRAEQRPDGRWAYHPVAVRHRRTLDPGQLQSADALIATLDAPALADAVADADHVARVARAQLLLLAHVHRMLEAMGHDSVRPVGAIIGKEEVPVWVALDAPTVRQRWDKRRAADETALQRYDFEFSFRLDVLAAAAEGTPIVEPVWIGECSTCPWVAHCRPRLESADSVSLLPGLGYEQWRTLRRRGVATRADLAALDVRSSVVRDAYVRVGDLAALLARAALVDRATPVAELVPEPTDLPAPVEAVPDEVGPDDAPLFDDVAPPPDRTGPRRAVLERHGVATAADLLALDPIAVALAGKPVRSLVDAVFGARAIVHHGGAPILRYGVDALRIPSADVEIDIDMENGIDGTAYLWGAWVDDEYLAAASWEPAGPVVEASVFAEFWDWLSARRRAAIAAERTLITYCWYRGAEAGALREGAAAAAEHLGRVDDPAAVEAFLASPEFVDLWEVFTTQLVTGASHGLKVVAALAGFSWRDTDPDGALSMVWHDHATTDPDPAARQAARRRLLAYNEDDVRATAAVRHWMRTLPL
ncbi:hypothetical protein BH10ACT1_BH10ACT1_19030 [soil metagenome]